MTTPENVKSRRNTTLDTLVATYPVFRDCRPLALGIHKVLQERHPELSKAQIRSALKIHTAMTRYLKTLSQSDQRVDLDGQPAGEITPEQREVATTEVKERIKRTIERKKAETELKKRQESLKQLAEKFNTR